MPVVLWRVDNRLVHGQVLEVWVPRLGVEAILVVDQELAADQVQRMVFRTLDRETLPVRLCGLGEARALLEGPWRDRRVLVLFAGVAQAQEGRRGGLRFEALNLGNVHARPGSRALTPSVYLAPEDESRLRELRAEGVTVEARAVPADRTPDVGIFLGERA